VYISPEIKRKIWHYFGFPGLWQGRVFVMVPAEFVCCNYRFIFHLVCCCTYQHVRRHTLALPAVVESSRVRQASFPDLFLKWSDMNQKTWLPHQPFHKVIVQIFHNESCASFTDSVVPAIDDCQRCVSLLQAFFKLQIDETTKEAVLVTLLISRNCIHKLIGFVSCLQNIMHKYIVFSSLRHQQIDVLLWHVPYFILHDPKLHNVILWLMC